MTTLAVDRPVVVAVIVDRAFAVEEQTVLARLQGQGAIGAEEELITVLGVGVGLHAILLGAFGCANSQSICCNMIRDRYRYRQSIKISIFSCCFDKFT